MLSYAIPRSKLHERKKSMKRKEVTSKRDLKGLVAPAASDWMACSPTQP